MAIERIVRIEGTGLPLRGNDIDTDRIIPARFLKSVSFEGLERHLFEDDIKQAHEHGGTHALTDPRFASAAILVVNRNFGCGSSREHAPQAIRRRGIRAVVGESFSEIFFGNSVALGMPCVVGDRAGVERLQRTIESEPAAPMTIDLETGELRCRDWSTKIALPQGARESFLDGSWDATGLLLDRYEEVEQTAARLPYLEWSTQV
ncbi:MAG: 3-isopropylmalate dehydratase small subunit [Vicinamibacterales bacterium]